jgi:hypothetical protein
MKTCKIQNPKVIEQDIIKYVIKYNLLANIQGILQCHKT